MSENLKDILSHLHPDIDQETLLLYLQGKLSHQQQQQVEQGALEDSFEADALEGLGQFQDQQKILLLTEQLKADLRKKTEKKKRWRQKMALKPDGHLLVAVVIILLLVVLCFFVLHYYQNR